MLHGTSYQYVVLLDSAVVCLRARARVRVRVHACACAWAISIYNPRRCYMFPIRFFVFYILIVLPSELLFVVENFSIHRFKGFGYWTVLSICVPARRDSAGLCDQRKEHLCLQPRSHDHFWGWLQRGGHVGVAGITNRSKVARCRPKDRYVRVACTV